MLIQAAKHRKVVFVVLLLLFGFASIRMHLSLQGLSYQEQSLQAEIRRVFDSQPGSYVLTDRGLPPGVMDHDWNFYEFTGMIYKNKGTQQDFLILASHMGTLSLAGIPESFGNYKERYMASKAKWAAPYYCLKLNELVRMDEWNSLSMLIGELTGDNK